MGDKWPIKKKKNSSLLFSLSEASYCNVCSPSPTYNTSDTVYKNNRKLAQKENDKGSEKRVCVRKRGKPETTGNGNAPQTSGEGRGEQKKRQPDVRSVRSQSQLPEPLSNRLQRPPSPLFGLLHELYPLLSFPFGPLEIPFLFFCRLSRLLGL